MAELLLQNGLDPNIKRRGGNTALYMAARNGDLPCVRLLLKHGAAVDVGNDENVLPHIVATAMGFCDVVQELINHHAPVNAVYGKPQWRALHAGARGNLKMIQLLKMAGAELDARARYLQNTPLHLAVESSHTEAANELVKLGADPDAQSMHGRTALFIAVERGDVATAKLLVDLGTNDCLKSTKGIAAIHKAILSDSLEIVEILLASRYPTQNLADLELDTPLHYDARSRNLDILKILLTGLAEPALRNEQERTPLHIAASLGDMETVILLLEYSADPIARDKYEMLPLHLAAANGQATVAELLLSQDADCNATASNGVTPLHLAAAAASGSEDLVRILLHYGANANLRDTSGWTAEDIARAEGFGQLGQGNPRLQTSVYEVIAQKYSTPSRWSGKNKAQEVNISEDGLIASLGKKPMKNIIFVSSLD